MITHVGTLKRARGRGTRGGRCGRGTFSMDSRVESKRAPFNGRGGGTWSMSSRVKGKRTLRFMKKSGIGSLRVDFSCEVVSDCRGCAA